MATIKLPPINLLLFQLRENGFPEPLHGKNEYHFIYERIKPGKGIRKRLAAAGLHDWRFDIAWPDQKIAIECDGGQFSFKGHGGHQSEYEKINMAQSMGWKVYRFSNRMIENGMAIKFMRELS